MLKSNCVQKHSFLVHIKRMAAIFVLFLLSFGFCMALISLSYFFGAKAKVTKAKVSAYECGIPSSPQHTSRVPVKFFLTGILFIVFDIEIIFTYPFAIYYREFLASDQALSILFAVGLFLLLFLFGLWWEIKTKALEWK